jgi:opacity protein-like surface antigen
MKPLTTLTALSLAGVCLSSAQAQTFYPLATDYYAEAGLVAMELKDNGQSYNPNSMRLIAGKTLNRNLSLEGMYAFTINSDNQPNFDAKSTHYGIALKPYISINENTEVFARAGYGRSHVTASASGEKSLSDWSYAIGVQTKFTPDIYGQLDYTNFVHKDGAWAQGIGFSVGMRFY